MARMSIVVALLMSLSASASFAASLPGQDINAHANVSYYTQSAFSVCATVDFTDSTNAAVQSSSEPSMAIIESSAAPVSAGPARAFVAPDANAPIYCTVIKALYAGPSLVGKRVKVAGRLFANNGAPYLDNGGNVAVPDPSQPGGMAFVPASVALRTDLIASWPADGSLVTVQGVVRMESDGSITLLPFANSSFVTTQQ